MTETHQSGFAEVNGTRLYYEMAGTGHPLVLIHGGLVNRRLWDEQFPVFAQHYQAIRFDIRGFGDSAPPTPETPPYFLEEDIRSLLRFLGVEKTFVMGLSMGGALAINFTLMYPEMVEALIPVAMGLGGYEAPVEDKEIERWQQVGEAAQSGNIAQAVEITLRVWTDGPGRTPDQVNPAVREKVRAMTTHNFELPEDDNATQPQEPEPPAISRLAEIHVPTLIILGDQDVPSILKIADILEKGIPGATKVVIPDTAHHLPMEKPEEFNRVVLDFLGSLARSRG